jgi:uncharacterized protein YybS (DUF2232 family)
MPVSASAHDTPEPRPAALVGAALGSALLFSSMPVPVVGLLGAMVSPLPLIVQRLRSGFGGTMLAFLLAAALVAGVFSAGHGVQFVALAFPVLLIGESMARGRGLVRGCAWAFVVLGLEIGTALLFAGPRLVDPMLKEAAHLRSPEFLDDMRSTGVPPEMVEQWAEQSASFQQVLEVVYPAAFLIAGAVVVLANASFLRIYLARRDPGWLDGGEFETIRWPFGVAVLFVLAGASVMVAVLRTAAYNVLLIVAFFFALQGLAVVAFYARRLAGPPFLRFAVTVMVLVNPWAPQILALLGLFDTWFDFRKWAEPPKGERRE